MNLHVGISMIFTQRKSKPKRSEKNTCLESQILSLYCHCQLTGAPIRVQS